MVFDVLVLFLEVLATSTVFATATDFYGIQSATIAFYVMFAVFYVAFDIVIHAYLPKKYA